MGRARMTADMPNFGRKGMTQDEWVEAMKTRRRNLTDPHPGLRHAATDPTSPHVDTSVFDDYLKEMER